MDGETWKWFAFATERGYLDRMLASGERGLDALQVRRRFQDSLPGRHIYDVMEKVKCEIKEIRFQGDDHLFCLREGAVLMSLNFCSHSS